MKHIGSAILAAILIAGLVRTSAAAGPTTMPTAAEMILLADRSTEELRRGISSADEAINVASNNLANARTVAFKRLDALPNGKGVAEIRVNTEQGSLENTARPLDVAIQGPGFFKVKVIDTIGNGFAYTRDGNFFINSDGELIIAMGDGYRLDPPVNMRKGVTEDQIQISETGQIFSTHAGTNTKTLVGQLRLVTFNNPGALKLLGGSLYLDTDKSGQPVDLSLQAGGPSKTLTGFLEGSNVNLEQEKLRLEELHEWRAAMIEAAEDKRPLKTSAAAPAETSPSR